MVYEASGLTSETPKRSTMRKGGLLCSQFYASVKELFDAPKCKPFDNNGLERMALDPQIRRGVHTTVQGHLFDPKIIEQAYIASKRRASIALEAPRQKSFGIREEHRVSWPLFREIRATLSSNYVAVMASTLTSRPSYAWAAKSEIYSDFLRRSAD